MTATDAEHRRTVVESALEVLHRADPLLAVQLVMRQEPGLALGVFCDLQRHLYWQRHDIRLSSAMGQAGLVLGLIEADRVEATDPAAAQQLRGAAKGLAYDLGSFNWPGWDEPSIDLGPHDIACGLDAARTNLRLAVELQKPPLPMSHAHWLLGAHQLAAGDHPAALDRFAVSVELARGAQATREVLLGEGFAHLTRLLAAPEDRAAQEAYQSNLADLPATDDGNAILQQLEDARQRLSAPLPQRIKEAAAPPKAAATRVFLNLSISPLHADSYLTDSCQCDNSPKQVIADGPDNTDNAVLVS